MVEKCQAPEASTVAQDLTTQREALVALGVESRKGRECFIPLSLRHNIDYRLSHVAAEPSDNAAAGAPLVQQVISRSPARFEVQLWEPLGETTRACLCRLAQNVISLLPA